MGEAINGDKLTRNCVLWRGSVICSGAVQANPPAPLQNGNVRTPLT